MAEKFVKEHKDRRLDWGKVRSREEIISCFHDGQTIAVGGQAGCNAPWRLIDCLMDSGAKHLTIYSIDCHDPGIGIGKLIRAGRVDRMITTHMGTNPEASQRMLSGEMQMELAPMGSFIERIRCGGAGLGGVLTKTGLNTVAQEGKQIITVKGEQYLLEEALHADVAITRARRADLIGNLAYRGTGTASHPIIATAADLSIVECDLLCDVAEIAPDDVRVPGVYIDMILA